MQGGRVLLCAVMTLVGALAPVGPVARAEGGADTVWRDPADQPFSDSSIWNTPLGNRARFLPADHVQTQMLRSENVGARAGSYPWIDDGALNLYRASDKDAEAIWRYEGRNLGDGWTRGGALHHGELTMATPEGVKGGKTSDQEAIVIEADGRHAIEGWHVTSDPKANGYKATYLVEVDLRGSGMGASEGESAGVRAFGGSLLGGMVRCDELRRRDIRHALAVELSNTQMKAAARPQDRKVWPATVVDANSEHIYLGQIPLGSLVAIRPEVDLTRLKLSAEGLALARAYQRFGGYVVDTTIHTMVLAVMENGCPQPMVAHLTADKRIIRDQLSIVTNNGPQHPGGPGRRVAPRPPRLKPEKN